jgi:hypothetical protein
VNGTASPNGEYPSYGDVDPKTDESESQRDDGVRQC